MYTFSDSTWQNIYKANLALVNETFKRCLLIKKLKDRVKNSIKNYFKNLRTKFFIYPIDLLELLALTLLNKMMSFSRPWYASTVPISILSSCLKKFKIKN